MPTILMWNVQGKELDPLVFALTNRFSAGVIVLLEHTRAQGLLSR